MDDANEFEREELTRPIPFVPSSEVARRWAAGDVEPPIAVTDRTTRDMRPWRAK